VKSWCDQSSSCLPLCTITETGNFACLKKEEEEEEERQKEN